VTLYVIKLSDGSYKQIFIDQKHSVDNIYDFRFANLDGTGEQIVNLDLSMYTDKNFLYYSLVNNQEVDREPLSSSWDLLFTRYYSEDIYYFVTGVLSNINTQVAEVTGVDPESAVFNEGDLSDNISTIGYDWKSFDMSTFSYNVVDSLTYFVKTPAQKVYKLVFTVSKVVQPEILLWKKQRSSKILYIRVGILPGFRLFFFQRKRSKGVCRR